MATGTPMTEAAGEPALHRVAMRDGVRLATDVYGAGSGPRPVVLERTPYGRRAARASDGIAFGRPVPEPEENAARFVAAGFVVVRQDCRGRGDSEGVFEKYLAEADGGEDTIEWVAAQPWCDGRVAMTGVSYSAHAQTAVAARAPRALAAMIVDSGGLLDAFENGVR